MNKAYLKGRAFEYQTMTHLKKMGCLVSRSAGSHGVWDLVAVARGPFVSADVRAWLSLGLQREEAGYLSTSVEWLTQRGARSSPTSKRLYFRVIPDGTIDGLVVLIQCKTKTKSQR